MSDGDSDCLNCRYASMMNILKLVSVDLPDPISLPPFSRQHTFRIHEKMDNDLEEEFDSREEEDDQDPFRFCPRMRLYDWDNDSDDEEYPSPADWSTNDTRVSVPFTGTPRPVSLQDPTPMKYFKLLFNEDFITFLTNTINTRAEKLAAEKKRQYHPTDNEEVYTVLCLHYLIRCFSGAACYRYGHFGRFMRLPRYQMLFNILTETVNPDFDGEYKNAADRRVWYDVAKPVVDKFNELMKQLMSPGKVLKMNVSQTFMGLGQIYFKQQSEPGHMHFLVDKDNVVQRIYLKDPAEQVSGQGVALAMMGEFLNKGHSLYCCPHYASIALAEELLKQKTLLTGNLKQNNFENPAFNKSSKQLIVRVAAEQEPNRKGKVVKVKIVSGYNKNGVCIAKCYRPDYAVIFLSTEFNGDPARRERNFECEVVESLANNFNPTPWETMEHSFLSMTEPVNQQVLYTLQAMLVNAHLLYNLSGAPRLNRRDFLENIICQLLPVDFGFQSRNPNA